MLQFELPMLHNEVCILKNKVCISQNKVCILQNFLLQSCRMEFESWMSKLKCQRMQFALWNLNTEYQTSNVKHWILNIKCPGKKVQARSLPDQARRSLDRSKSSIYQILIGWKKILQKLKDSSWLGIPSPQPIRTQHNKDGGQRWEQMHQFR